MDPIERYEEHPKRAEAIAALAKVRNDSNDCACDGCLVDAVLEAIAPHNTQGAVDPAEIIAWLRGRTGYGGGFTSADDVADAIERKFIAERGGGS